MNSFNIIVKFYEYLNDKFTGQIPNLIFFAIGIIIGIFLFLIFSFVIYLIYKLKSKQDKKKIEPLPVNDEYKNIIDANKDIYKSVYLNASLNEKINGIGKIMLNLMESISLLYYPNSKDSMFEISIEQLVDFLKYFSIRLEDFIDNLLDNRLHIVNVVTKYSIKDKKLSFVIELINKNKEIKQEKKNGLFERFKNKITSFGKKIVYKISGNIVDSEFLNMIDSLGEDINKLYSKQTLSFKSIYKKNKNYIIESGGDNNE